MHKDQTVNVMERGCREMTEGLDGTVCADLPPLAVNSLKTGYMGVELKKNPTDNVIFKRNSLQDIMGGIHFKCESWFLSASA